MRSAYLTSSRLAQLRNQLTDVEWSVLHDVATMRLAVATDLQALHQLRPAPLSVRSFRRLLARLTEQQLIERLDRTVGGRAKGSAGFVYGLGGAGQRLIGSAGDRARRPWTPRPAWFNHALAVGRCYLRLRQAETPGQLALKHFDVEPTCWRPFNHLGSPVVLKPDAYAEIWLDDYEYRLFIEVDCGSESRTVLARKLSVYRHYWQSGTEQDRYGVFPQVLWLVPDQIRLEVLADVAGRQPPESWALHRMALQSDFPKVLLDPPQ